MEVIYEKLDNQWSTLSEPPVSFRVYYDTESEYHLRKVLESELKSDLFKGNITFDIHDSVVTMSIRYHFFKEIFDAFINGAIIIKYHGYELLPDIENLTLTDHRDSMTGKDRVFTLVKFPAKFDFQVK